MPFIILSDAYIYLLSHGGHTCAVNQGAFAGLESLIIQGVDRIYNKTANQLDRCTDGIISLLRCISHSAHLPALKSLQLIGGLGQGASEEDLAHHPLLCIAKEDLDLTHLSCFVINDGCLTTVTIIESWLSATSNWGLQSLGCKMIIGALDADSGYMFDLLHDPTIECLHDLMIQHQTSSERVLWILQALLSHTSWIRYGANGTKGLARGITTGVITHSSDVAIIKLIINKLADQDRATKAVVYQLISDHDHLEAIYHLFSSTFRYANRRARGDDEDRPRQEVALTFLLQCLQGFPRHDNGRSFMGFFANLPILASSEANTPWGLILDLLRLQPHMTTKASSTLRDIVIAIGQLHCPLPPLEESH